LRGVCGLCGGRWGLLSFVAAHYAAQTKTEAANQNQTAKKAHQPHRAERQLGVAPVLDRLKLFLFVIDFVHSALSSLR
jgi:hypothetical protein